MEQYYFKTGNLDIIKTKHLTAEETLLGVVFTPGVDEKGDPVSIPFQRVQHKDGNIYLKELLDNPSLFGCPYPPPCKPGFKKDCY